MKLLVTFLTIFSFVSTAAEASKFFELELNQESYLAGETAIFHARIYGKPENPDFEFDLSMEMNSVSLPITKASDFSYFSRSENLAPGTQSVSATLYIQDKNYANQLKLSIQTYQQKIQSAQDQLEEETDPERIGELNAEIAKYSQLKNAAEAQLSSIRTKVRGPITKTFTVN